MAFVHAKETDRGHDVAGHADFSAKRANEVSGSAFRARSLGSGIDWPEFGGSGGFHADSVADLAKEGIELWPWLGIGEQLFPTFVVLPSQEES